MYQQTTAPESKAAAATQAVAIVPKGSGDGEYTLNTSDLSRDGRSESRRAVDGQVLRERRSRALLHVAVAARLTPPSRVIE